MTAATDERRVVVAEDSLVVRAVVRHHLEARGYRVIEADDGEAALRACRESLPHAALLDIEMPALDGFQVLKALKAEAALAEIPVVFLTGRTSTEDVVEGLELGAHDYLRKPFEPPELIARVAAAVQVKVLQDELRLRNAELERISRTDALTGLYNRRHAEEQLRHHLQEATRQGRALSVLLFDLDHFKAINDEYGHASGDAVLQAFAARLTGSMGALGADGIAARWGGEEFLTVLPEADAAGALAIAEAIRDAVGAALVELPDGRTCAMTTSAGCATASIGDAAVADWEQLVRRADEALYAAKANGRNQVAVAS